MGFLRKRSAERPRTAPAPPPPKAPPKEHDIGVDDEILEDLKEAFDNLYDPLQMNHLSLKEQLARVKKRDLNDAKFYKAALKFFGSQPKIMEKIGENKGRKRVIIAAPRDKYRGGDPEILPVRSCMPLGTSPSIVNERRRQAMVTHDQEAENLTTYKSWLQKRQHFRHNLDTFGDPEQYLRGKPGLSGLERRVLKKIEDSRKVADDVESSDDDDLAGAGGKNVSVKRPSPLALAIIDAELRRKRLRLLDLFTSVDKDKNWCLDRDEFRRAFKVAKINMPESLLEDLIITLDSDNDNELDYRELHSGLHEFRRERRQGAYKLMDLTALPSTLLSSRRQTTDITEESESLDTQTEFSQSFSRDPTLTPPPPDIREERYVNDNAEMSVDLRQRDRTALSRFNTAREKAEQEKWRGPAHVRKLRKPQSSIPVREVILTGNASYDAHCHPSTLLTGKPTLPPLEDGDGLIARDPRKLDEELADQVDRFRQNQFREYMALVRLCEERGMTFNHRLMERLLLHPGDKPVESIKKKVRQPGSSLKLNSRFYEAGSGSRIDPAAMESATTVVDNRRRLRPTNMASLGQALPMAEELQMDEDELEMELSTGEAIIRRKVDCWLTFEEYRKLTNHLDYSKHSHNSHSSPNAFWPGKLLNILRNDDNCVYSSKVFFQPLQRPNAKKGNPGHFPKEGFPVNRGHVTYGTIDPMLRYEITNPRR